MKKNRTDLLPISAGIGMAIIWGFSFLFTKNALDYTLPLQLMGFRFATAAILLSLLRLIKIIKVDFKNKKWTNLIPLALFQPGLYFIGETWGIKWTSASEAGMIIALVPIAVATMAAFFLKERLHPLQITSILASVAGVIAIVITQGDLIIGQHFWGFLALIGAVLAAGIYGILSKRSSNNFTPLEITFVMMWVAAIIFNILGISQSLFNGTMETYLNPFINSHVIWAVFYLGGISSVLAFFLANYMIAHLPVSRTAPLYNLITVVSVFAGVVLLREPFSWFQAFGVCLILLGVWGTNNFVYGEDFIPHAKRTQ